MTPEHDASAIAAGYRCLIVPFWFPLSMRFWRSGEFPVLSYWNVILFLLWLDGFVLSLLNFDDDSLDDYSFSPSGSKDFLSHSVLKKPIRFEWDMHNTVISETLWFLWCLEIRRSGVLAVFRRFLHTEMSEKLFRQIPRWAARRARSRQSKLMVGQPRFQFWRSERDRERCDLLSWLVYSLLPPIRFEETGWLIWKMMIGWCEFLTCVCVRCRRSSCENKRYQMESRPMELI